MRRQIMIWSVGTNDRPVKKDGEEIRELEKILKQKDKLKAIHHNVCPQYIDWEDSTEEVFVSVGSEERPASPEDVREIDEAINKRDAKTIVTHHPIRAMVVPKVLL